MNIRELMIGDMVKRKSMCAEGFRYEPVLAFGTHRVLDGKVIVYTLLEGHPYPVPSEDWIEPIPLTEKILELNGFEMDDEYDNGDRDYFCHGYDFNYLNCTRHKGKAGYQFSIASDDDDNVYKRCRYVHELQHALRLSGLDELADNFRVE